MSVRVEPRPVHRGSCVEPVVHRAGESAVQWTESLPRSTRRWSR